MNENNNTKIEENQEGKENGVFHLGYNAKDDIYNIAKNEVDIDPENIALQKFKNENNQDELDDNDMGNGLDVPGSELDDEQEKIGAEDEENNYYSLGLDNHNEVDENGEE
jgi:hypothetical protein